MSSGGGSRWDDDDQDRRGRKRDRPQRSPRRGEGRKHDIQKPSDENHLITHSLTTLMTRTIHGARKSREEPEVENKEKPNYKTSGALSQEDRVSEKGVETKYVEPPEGRKTAAKWRLYPFKGEESLDPIQISAKSWYLFGRDRTIVDIPTDHTSCSKQHAVLQWREVQIEDKITGMPKRVVKPYIIDLGSTNGTLLNGAKIDSERYIELLNKDALKFGFSTREYILLKENIPEAK